MKTGGMTNDIHCGVKLVLSAQRSPSPVKTIKINQYETYIE